MAVNDLLRTHGISRATFFKWRNRSYRTEALNAHLFESIAELQALTITWLRIYNEERPHDTAPTGCRPPRSCRGSHPPVRLLMRCLLDGESHVSSCCCSGTSKGSTRGDLLGWVTDITLPDSEKRPGRGAPTGRARLRSCAPTTASVSMSHGQTALSSAIRRIEHRGRPPARAAAG